MKIQVQILRIIQERKIKYGKCIRDIFQSNCRTIEKLGKELDELKIKKKSLFDT